MNPGEQLRRYQADNRRRTIEKIETAMRAIEAELREHGYYQHNDGRITRKELCRRAGLGESTLKNRTHSDTAAAADRWLKRLKKCAPTLKPQVEDAKQARIADLMVQLNRISHHYNQFKIEYDLIRRRNAELEEENITLRKEMAAATSGAVRSGGASLRAESGSIRRTFASSTSPHQRRAEPPRQLQK